MTTLAEPLVSVVMLVARVALAMVFLVSGIHKALWYQKAIEEFRLAGIPARGFLLPLTIALHIVAALFLILGIFAAEAALALAGFTLLVTLRVHCFPMAAGADSLLRSRDALANLAIMGGLILLAAVGPGRLVI